MQSTKSAGENRTTKQTLLCQARFFIECISFPMFEIVLSEDEFKGVGARLRQGWVIGKYLEIVSEINYKHKT